MASLDPSVINNSILSLEQQREELHRLVNDNSKYIEQAIDLASLLSVALRNNDLATIDALIISHGKIPSLTRARELLVRKLELLNIKRLNKINHDISSRLESTYVFELEELKSIKADIVGVNDESLQNKLISKLFQRIETLKQPLYSKFNELVSKSKWLKESNTSPELEKTFIDLINLQSLTNPVYPESLWAFDILAKNFKISFDYHFNSSKGTNSIDKPELFYNYLINYLNSNLMKISKFWRLSKTELNERFAHSEFITAAIKPVSSKLDQYIRLLSRNDDDDDELQLLTHLINETILFDTKLIDDFFYDPLNDSSWPGLFNNFSSQQLDRLLIRDSKLYSTQFDNIVNQHNLFQIDYSSVNDQDLKPTISSLKLKFLIENLTFKNFSKFFKTNYDSNKALLSFKLKVFSKIYLPILQAYLKRLEDGYDAFNELFRSSKSVIKNHSSQELNISGTSGLERIFRIYCSVKFISNNLNQWNQEFIFIELNELFNTHSTEISISLFDFLLNDYNKLETKIWNLLESFLSKIIVQSLKSYEYLNTWNAKAYNDNEGMKVSSELTFPIQIINTSISFIAKIIPIHEIMKLKQFIITEIVNFFIDRIIKSNHFNSQGVYQLAFDFQFLIRELKLSNFVNFPKYNKFEEFMKVLRLAHGDIHLQCFENVGIRQFAKRGEFGEFKEQYQLAWLSDSEILDVLLRIHV